GIRKGGSGNRVGTAASPIDPKLGTLKDNGGPTQTRALLTGSPAIDAGTNTGAPATDQRGFNRPVNTTADIGAYEFQPPATTTATPTSSVNPSTAGQPVTFTVTVTANAPGSNKPTGTVTFLDGNTALGTATLSNGTASLTTSALTGGTHSITAGYAGLNQGD